ncbi:MAG: hypothetical protein CMK36_09090 [Porticoccaceae bacterium]|nr:hypothetical protein [Porticoccaceae bacterium]
MITKDEIVRPDDVSLLLFLTLLNFVNYVDRNLIGSFANWIVPELDLSNTEFALISGVLFIFVYAIGGVLMGTIADRVNRMKFIAFGVAIWSFLTAVSGAARGFYSLAIPRMLVGVGESVLAPSALSTIGDRFPNEWQGFAVGVFGMAVPLGLGGSLFIVAYLEPLFGWRGCFYLMGLFGLVLALIAYFVRETPRTNKNHSSDLHISVPVIVATIFTLLKGSKVLSLTLAGSMIFGLLIGATVFDQLWFVQERGFDRNEIAGITAWLAIAGGLVGNFFGGLGGDLFMRKTGLGRPFFLALVMLCLAPLILAYRLVDPNSIWFLTGIFAIFFQMACFYAPVFATIQEIVPSNQRGLIFGFIVLMIQVAGVAIGITSGGILIDWFSHQGYSGPYTIVLVIYTCISFFAIPIFALAGWYFRDEHLKSKR